MRCQRVFQFCQISLQQTWVSITQKLDVEVETSAVLHITLKRSSLKAPEHQTCIKKNQEQMLQLFQQAELKLVSTVPNEKTGPVCLPVYLMPAAHRWKQIKRRGAAHAPSGNNRGRNPVGLYIIVSFSAPFDWYFLRTCSSEKVLPPRAAPLNASVISQHAHVFVFSPYYYFNDGLHP